MADDILVKTRAKRRQAPYRGPTSASEFNDHVDEVVSDLTDITDAINTLHSRTNTQTLIAQRELEALKARMSQLEDQKAQLDLDKASTGTSVVYTTDFRRLEGFALDSFAESRRCRVEPSYGQVVVPMNRIVNRFHSVNPSTNQIILADNINVAATAVQESGANSVTTGTPANAFNGNNTSFWIRQVHYPLGSDVDYVTVQLDADVPSRFNMLANMVYIRPFPLGTVDIDSVVVSSSSADPAIALPVFPAAGVENAGALRYIFPPMAVTKIRITLTQRNWVEHDDQKMFAYGLQELGVCLSEWDKTDEGSFLANNAFVQRISAPSGYEFNNITDFVSAPTYSTGGVDTGIQFQIYRDQALTASVWNSIVHPNPRVAAVDVSMHNISDLYVVGVLTYLTATSVTPVLTNIRLKYTTQ